MLPGQDRHHQGRRRIRHDPPAGPRRRWGPGRSTRPALIRFGQLTMDEFFVTEEAAREGVVISNPSRTDPIVMLKHFGPGNPDLPALMGTAGTNHLAASLDVRVPRHQGHQDSLGDFLGRAAGGEVGRSRAEWEREDVPAAPALGFRLPVPRDDAGSGRALRKGRPSRACAGASGGSTGTSPRIFPGFMNCREVVMSGAEGSIALYETMPGEDGRARRRGPGRHRRRAPGRADVPHPVHRRAPAGAHCTGARGRARAAHPGRAVSRPGSHLRARSFSIPSGCCSARRPELTVIGVTHHVEEIIDGYDRVLLLAGGRVVDQGTDRRGHGRAGRRTRCTVTAAASRPRRAGTACTSSGTEPWTESRSSRSSSAGQDAYFTVSWSRLRKSDKYEIVKLGALRRGHLRAVLHGFQEEALPLPRRQVLVRRAAQRDPSSAPTPSWKTDAARTRPAGKVRLLVPLVAPQQQRRHGGHPVLLCADAPARDTPRCTTRAATRGSS